MPRSMSSLSLRHILNNKQTVNHFADLVKLRSVFVATGACLYQQTRNVNFSLTTVLEVLNITFILQVQQKMGSV